MITNDNNSITSKCTECKMWCKKLYTYVCYIWQNIMKAINYRQIAVQIVNQDNADNAMTEEIVNKHPG